MTLKLKKRYEAELTQMIKGGYIEKDGSIAEWILEDLKRFKTTRDEFVKEHLIGILKPYFDYEKAKNEYAKAINVSPVDAMTGMEVKGDINQYLFNRAKEMFPIGVESVLEANIKQSSILKHRYFVDGLENEPAPKGVRQLGLATKQLSFYGTDEATIDDNI